MIRIIAMSDQLPTWATFVCAGLAACIAEAITIPIDTAKVRMQLQHTDGKGGARLGMFQTVRNVAKHEGVLALYRGLTPALQRQLVFASLRVGLYTKIGSYFKRPGEETISLHGKILSGFASGAIGMTVANPTDLVKVRLQSEVSRGPNAKSMYSGVWNAYSTIVKKEGLLGLWTGLGPSVWRNSVINATELASYESAKEYLMDHTSWGDSRLTHFASGAWAGLMATIIGNPIDVVKTRIMASPVTPNGVLSTAQVQYNGALDCIMKTMRTEGFFAFYQGVVPQFFRLSGWSIAMFLSFEELKTLARWSVAPSISASIE